MEIKKIKIITPNKKATHAESFPMAPPVLAYLAALVPGDIDVELFDTTKDPIDYDSHSDLVCISFMTPMAQQAEKIARRFREKGVRVVVGGNHPTFNPNEVKQFADTVFIGEAEDNFPKMFEHLKNDEFYDFYICGDYDYIPNLDQLNGKVFHLKHRPTLDNSPIPRKDLLKNKYRFDTIQTTRGCPFACDFCSVTLAQGGKIRSRPLEVVKKEVQSLGKTFFMIDDNCFTAPHIVEILKELIKSKKKRLWGASGSLSVVNHPKCDEILKLAAKSGLRLLMVGIESVEKANLLSCNTAKKIGHKGEPNIEFTKNAIKKIQSYGITVVGFMMFGFFDEEGTIFEKAYRFIKETNIIPLPGIVQLLPKTKLYYRHQDYLIPRRLGQYDLFGEPFITHYINKLTPYELESGLLNIEKKMYSWRRIFTQLIHTKPGGAQVLSLAILLAMRRISRYYLKKLEEIRLPDEEQLLAPKFLELKKAAE